MPDTILDTIRTMERASRDYKPEEWTPCPKDCAYCRDPFYGHPHPHTTQKRLSDGMTAREFIDSYID